MKVFSKLFLLFFVTGAFATQTVMIDPYGSPHAGSSNLIFLQELMIRGEDSFFSQPSQNSTLKICGRTLEQLLFWSNVNGIADVAQHEIFGHGYRLRELGYHNLGYSITPFSGSTRFLKEDYYRMTVRESLAIAVAGLEAEQILARDLKTQWIAQGEMDGRLALLYFQAQQSIFFYTLITHLGGLEGNHGSGNDIQSYMYFNNHSHLNGHLTHKKLFHWTLFNWLDPMTFYSAYSFFHYIGKGTPWKFPMISFGDNLKYLPNVKIGYAPYAPEAYLENFFLYKGVPFYFYLKGGKRSMGLGFSCDRLLSGKRGSLGCKLRYTRKLCLKKNERIIWNLKNVLNFKRRYAHEAV